MTTTAAPILAIDLGKYKSVACWYAGADAQATFETFPTHPDTLRLLLGRQAVGAVIVEACVHAGWVHDLCATLKIPCHVAVTSGEAWKWKNVKRKTDRDDALKLAHLFALGQLHTVCVPDPDVRQWKALIGQRRALVCRRVSVQNRIRALIAGQGLSLPRGAAAWASAGLQVLDDWAKPLAACGDGELWQGQLHLLLLELRQLLELVDVIEKRLDQRAAHSEEVQLLDTIAGVGIRTAEEIVTHLGDAKRFHKASEVSAFAGLVPRQYQSGESDRRGRVTKRGPKRLRTALVECAWAALRYNAWARAVYLRISRGSKARKKQAVVALARKLLVRCWAMLRSKQKWRDPTATTQTAEGTATWQIAANEDRQRGKKRAWRADRRDRRRRHDREHASARSWVCRRAWKQGLRRPNEGATRRMRQVRRGRRERERSRNSNSRGPPASWCRLAQRFATAAKTKRQKDSPGKRRRRSAPYRRVEGTHSTGQTAAKRSAKGWKKAVFSVDCLTAS